MTNEKCPKKKGQKYKADDMELTVSAFFGADGVKFPTYDETKAHNNSASIHVENLEFGGSISEKYCFLIN
jgi:hypothetical protein